MFPCSQAFMRSQMRRPTQARAAQSILVLACDGTVNRVVPALPREAGVRRFFTELSAYRALSATFGTTSVWSGVPRSSVWAGTTLFLSMMAFSTRAPRLTVQPCMMMLFDT